ncbi:hypothetical protein DFJ63DRAFT_313394 [Scheffersomyces coipomensis]|uniref:uncharacterized protein n=1 Tax=Scheffersomyces coipomensis TaxID=1788519 RepID=UPI00315D64D2
MLLLGLSLFLSLTWGFEVNIDGLSQFVPVPEVLSNIVVSTTDNKYINSIQKAFNLEFSQCIVNTEKNNETYQHVELFNNDEKLLQCSLLNDVYENCQDAGLKDNNFWFFQLLIESTCKEASDNEENSNIYQANGEAEQSEDSLKKESLRKRLLDPRFKNINFDEYYNKNLPKAMSYDCGLMSALKTTVATDPKVLTRYTSSFIVAGAIETHLTTLELIKVVGLPQPSMVIAKRDIDEITFNYTSTSSSDDKFNNNQNTLFSTLIFTFILIYLIFQLSLN